MQSHLNKSVLIFLFLILLSGTILSQSEQYKFRHLNTEDGLPSNFTLSVMKDSRGFVWITTRAGLCRYDGYNVKVYQYDPYDTTSISHNRIWGRTENIVEDDSGYIWICTYDGLNKFDVYTETFRRYKHDPLDPESIASNIISCIFKDKEGTIWIGTFSPGGLNKYNPEKDNFATYSQNPGDSTWSIDNILSIYEENSEVFWIGTTNGLFKFDKKTGYFDGIKVSQNLVGNSDKIQIKVIAEDFDGTPIFGTLQGFLKYDKNNNELIPSYPHYNKNDIIVNLDILLDPFDDKNSLWVITGDLFKFDRQTGKRTYINHDRVNSSSLIGKALKSIYIDESGMMWVAGEFGVNISNPELNPVIKHMEFKKTYGDNATALLKDSEDHLWIGNFDGEIFHFDNQMRLLRHYNYLPVYDPGMNYSSSVWDIYEDHNKNIWVCTDYNGLYYLNNGKGEFEPCKLNGFQGSSKPMFIYDFIEDSQGVLWVGTSSGLYQCNPGSSSPTLFNNIHSGYDIDYQLISDIFEDSNGNLWVATAGSGIFCQTPKGRKSNEFINYKHDPEKEHSLSHDWIWSIYEDVNGTVWIATNHGLNSYSKENDNFNRHYFDDLPGANYMYDLTGDNDGNLWINTENGLVRYKPSNDTLNNPGVLNYKQIIPFKDIFPYKIYKSKKGNIYVGGANQSENGYYSINPKNVKDNLRIPPITITDFKIANEEVLLDSSITSKKQLKLKYNQNFFFFEFAALDFVDPGKNQYAYYLEGFEEDWIYSGKRRFANYTEVSPGSYTFHVKGSNNDGYWNETGISIAIKILPPPWKTWWAYSLYFIILLGIIYAWRRYDLKRQRLKQELEIEHVESEKLKELDSMKSRFFANISHEFRTPLTLILGPLEKLRSKIVDHDSEQDLNMMQRNAIRLRNLIDQLLNLSKLESGMMKLNASEKEIVSLVNGYVQSFESLAKQKNINLIFTSIEKNIKLFIDKDKIEKILYNLLSNAFKFTGEGGKITVEITQLAEDKGVNICISDSGKGIPPEKLKHIFDRFYQADDSYTKDQEGTGIGLALTKELVDVHHGNINVESEVGLGTTFIIYLPMGKEHLNQEEIIVHEDSCGESDVQEESFVDPLEIADQLNDTISQKRPIEKDQDNSKPLLLVVEDNNDLRSYIGSYLKNDFRIFEAVDGVMGLEKAIDNIPDLIISDVMMPKMDGIELCKMLKSDERTSHIPVILLTARAGKESKIEGLETGADDFITKPFDIDELRTRIRNLIEQRKKLQQWILKEFKKPGIDHILSIDPPDLTSMDQQFYKRLTKIVLDNISNPEFKVENLVAEMNMSHSQLHRKMVALTSQTANQFIRSVRLTRAAELISNKTATVTEIAFDMGFNNLSYFAKCFREQFGVLPSEYNKQ